MWYGHVDLYLSESGTENLWAWSGRRLSGGEGKDPEGVSDLSGATRRNVAGAEKRAEFGAGVGGRAVEGLEICRNPTAGEEKKKMPVAKRKPTREEEERRKG